jgi:transmembrane sensor
VESISEQAARWVARADSGSLQENEQRELEAWLSADPRHRGAYARAWAYWINLDRLAALNGPAIANITPYRHGRRTGLSRRGLLAAGIAAVTSGGGLSWYLLYRRSPAPALAQQHSSGIGEVKRVVLEEGSVLLLNTASVVSVQFAEHQRTIRLITGEVLFEVAHDSARPFVVVTDDGAVRAVGTAFVVRVKSNQADVTVTEGVVEVANSPAEFAGGTVRSSSAANVARVSAIQRAIITGVGTPEVQAIAPADVDRQFAWREGMVYFGGESLQTAVSEINRYNRRQIIVDDLTLSTKPIVGVFRVTDLDGFAAAAAAALKARVATEGQVIRLEPQSAPGN